MFFSIDFAQWKSVSLPHIIYMVIHLLSLFQKFFQILEILRVYCKAWCGAYYNAKLCLLQYVLH